MLMRVKQALRILVVEDHAELARFITAVLSTAGCVVLDPVSDYDEALAAAGERAFDLAVIDRMLRGREATAIVDLLTARRIPVLLISGYARSLLPQRLQNLLFLEKPFTPQALLDAVSAAAQGLP